jgi:hypothetical protein
LGRCVKLGAPQTPASALSRCASTRQGHGIADSPEKPAPVIRSALAPLLAFTLLAATPAAAQVAASASYVVTISGVNIAQMDIDLSDTGSRYSLDLSARVSGFGAIVASGTASAQASGALTGSGLVSDSFNLETRANGEQFTVDVDFANRAVTAFKVNPPVLDTWDRIPLERRHLTGVGDFLSAFVLRGRALSGELCNRRAEIFTGVERFTIRMAHAGDDTATSPRTGYQGPVVLCSIDYDPISGHYSESEITNYLADSQRMLVWFAPLGTTGYFIPYRAIVGTGSGDLSMVLTKLSY